MSPVLTELVGVLALERIEENIFRGQSQDLGWRTIFGGQVLGQALSAATQTVPADRLAHSLHAYFLRPGDAALPVVYEVDRIRDGGTFTTRRVVAVQKGEAIFILVASFQLPEVGFEHADPVPAVPPPDGLLDERTRRAAFIASLPERIRKRADKDQPFELRPVEDYDDLLHPTSGPARRMVWLRAVGTLPDDPALHRCLLAWVSDHMFLTTALLPHGVTWYTPDMQVASLDHALWFHDSPRVDDWLLHVIDSPAAHGGRGLVRGSIFTREGRLVASTTQEGLIRRRAKAG
jgi:acyl-CoA thioesterase-2